MRAGLIVLVCGLLGLVGCGGGGPIVSTVTQPIAPLPGAALTGIVSNGSQPVVGAHVYLLAANTTGYGGVGIAASNSNASVSVVAEDETGNSDAVGAYAVTGSNGQFSLTGDYACSSGQQLYLYALGGTNPAVGLMAAIGSCPAIGSPAIFATVNEVTTIAAAYAFAGFATDATHVSSSGTALAQVGIKNAFANAANLAALSTGTALATTPAGNGTAPQAEINTLANILASCVSAASSCSTLLGTATADGAATGTKPTDTATAAINIAHNPGANVASLYGLATTNSPFTPTLRTVPNDFTIMLAFTGGGMGDANSIAIDGSGNAWITSNLTIFAVAELASNGAAISPPSGYTGGGLQYPGGLAIDTAGNVWVINGQGGVIEFNNSGVAILEATTPYYAANAPPTAIAVDGLNNIWISNAYNNVGYLLKLNDSGVLISPQAGYTGGGKTSSGPIAIDSSGNVWTTNPTYISTSYPVYTVSEFSNSGSAISSSSGFTGGGLGYVGLLVGIAIDHSGDAWVVSSFLGYAGAYPSGDVSELSSSGFPISPSTGYAGGGLYYPGDIAIDGSGNVWVEDLGCPAYNSNLVSWPLLSEFTNAGGAISPATGYQVGETYPRGCSTGLAIDGSGDVWMSDDTTIASALEVIGVAAPVVTPISVGVKNNMLGTRP